MSSGISCCPNYLRAEERLKRCDGDRVRRYAKIRNYLQKYGEGDPQPPMLRTSTVMDTVMTEYTKSKCLHADPFEVLNIIKWTVHFNSVHDIRKNSFRVEYWTNQQIHVYQKFSRMYGGTNYVDSTGIKVHHILFSGRY